MKNTHEAFFELKEKVETCKKNQKYFDSYIKGTYPLKGEDDLQAFHHHIYNKVQVVGQNSSLILASCLTLFGIARELPGDTKVKVLTELDKIENFVRTMNKSTSSFYKMEK